MNKTKFFILFALLTGLMWPQSCSSGGGGDENECTNVFGCRSSSSAAASSAGTVFCVYEAEEGCVLMPGTTTTCPGGGQLNDVCPYSSGGGSGSSNGSGASSGSGSQQSSSDAATFNYCLWSENGEITCSEKGFYTSCLGGGTLSNICPEAGDPDAFCLDNPPEPQKPANYGADFTDARNGKVYGTVIIGSQIWMESNMNYIPSSGKTKCYGRGDEVDPNTTLGWLTTEAAEANCNKYGALYDWEAANDACPDGWHLPSRDEWLELKEFVYDELFQNCEDYFYSNGTYGWDVATKLKAVDGWKSHDEQSNKGRDSYGFKAIGGGFCVNCNTNNLTAGSGYYSGVEMNYKNGNQSASLFNPDLNLSVNASWWSDTQQNATDAYAYEMTYDKNSMNEKRHNKTEYLLSVRCIKDGVAPAPPLGLQKRSSEAKVRPRR